MRLVVVLLLAAACGCVVNQRQRTIQFTASGEVLALGGYAFPPANADAAAFVDGWEIHFTKLLDHLRQDHALREPRHLTHRSVADRRPGGGGGRAVGDRSAPGRSLPGKGGAGEQAYPLALLDNQNKNGGKAFDPSVRYAFGFDLVPATASAQSCRCSRAIRTTPT